MRMTKMFTMLGLIATDGLHFVDYRSVYLLSFLVQPAG